MGIPFNRLMIVTIIWIKTNVERYFVSIRIQLLFCCTSHILVMLFFCDILLLDFFCIGKNFLTHYVIKYYSTLWKYVQGNNFVESVRIFINHILYLWLFSGGQKMRILRKQDMMLGAFFEYCSVNKTIIKAIYKQKLYRSLVFVGMIVVWLWGAVCVNVCCAIW